MGLEVTGHVQAGGSQTAHTVFTGTDGTQGQPKGQGFPFASEAAAPLVTAADWVRKAAPFLRVQGTGGQRKGTTGRGPQASRSTPPAPSSLLTESSSLHSAKVGPPYPASPRRKSSNTRESPKFINLNLSALSAPQNPHPQSVLGLQTSSMPRQSEGKG